MDEEREELVKRAFPRIRKFCEERGLSWTDVDLRWGVTEAQIEGGLLLPICFGEIERCQPYFIAILGERYGWVPSELPEGLLDRYPWLANHPSSSITELEILGALRQGKAPPGTFFYFRDPSYVSKAAEQQRADYVDDDPASQLKLQQLKERIRHSGLPLRENYADPQTLANWVEEDLIAAIQKRFPSQHKPDAVERETLEHAAFARSRTAVYIPRQEYFERLDAFAKNTAETTGMVVLGESGGGKSALLANWAEHYRERHPEDVVLSHFIGASPASADWAAIVRRILAALNRLSGSTEAIPFDRDRLRAAFSTALERASSHGRIVIVIDALDQLTGFEQGSELQWLPSSFPAGIRLIVSTLPSRALRELQARGWPTLNVQPFLPAERRELIGRYLSQYAKSLAPHQVTRIAQADQASNPLFLQTLLEELRLFGLHQRLDARIDYYMAATAPEQLFDLILQRYEQDYERERPGLVREALSLVWVARRGLSETELTDMLGDGHNPLPHAYWSPLFLAMERSLIDRSGILNFFHNHLRRAVERRYITDLQQEASLHRRIADYFELSMPGDGDISRKADELPWHLMKIEEWQRLKDCISDLKLFKHLSAEARQYDLLSYWQSLGNRYDMLQTYLEVIDVEEARLHAEAGESELNPDLMSLSNTIRAAGDFIGIVARRKGTEQLYRRALAIKKEFDGRAQAVVASMGFDASGTDTLSLADTLPSLSGLAMTHHYQGDNSEAERLLREVLNVEERAFGHHTGAGLNNLAVVLRARGGLEEAERLCIQALEISQRENGPEHPDTAGIIHNLGLTLAGLGRHREAADHLEHALAIEVRELGSEHIETAKTRLQLADCFYQLREYQEAERLAQMTLQVQQQRLSLDHPDTLLSLRLLARVHRQNEAFDKAEETYRRLVEIGERIHGQEDPDTMQDLEALALVLEKKGNYDGAEPLLLRTLRFNEIHLGPEHPRTIVNLSNLAQLYFEKEDYKQAEPYCRRALAIREKVLGSEHEDTATSVNDLAAILVSVGDFAAVEALYLRALDIRRKIFGADDPTTLFSVRVLARFHASMERYAEAEPYFRELLASSRRLHGLEHLQTAQAINDLGEVLMLQGSVEAVVLFRCALDIGARLLAGDDPFALHVSRNLGNARTATDQLVNQLFKTGAFDALEDIFRKMIHYNEELLGPEHDDTGRALFNLAILFREKKQVREAEVLLYRAMSIFAIRFGPQDSSTLSVRKSLKELTGSEPRLRKLDVQIYNVDLPTEGRTRAFVSLARPEDTRTGGLPAPAIAGEAIGSHEALRPANFRPNGAFVAFLHNVIGESAVNCPWLRYQALKIGNGIIPVVDQRSASSNAPLLLEDVIGQCEARDGHLVGYQWSESHRLVTEHGFMQLDPWFEARLDEALQQLLRPSN